MKAKLLFTSAVLLLTATLALGQGLYNARTKALGMPAIAVDTNAVNGVAAINLNLIDDISDIFFFPSEVVASTNILQGVADDYVYASKVVTGAVSVGFLFNKSAYTDLSGFSANLANVGAGLATAVDATNPANSYGNPPTFALDQDGKVGTAGHLLLGSNMGNLLIGLDLFREASKRTWDSTKVAARTIHTVGSAAFGSLGIDVGLQLKINALKIKASVGFVSLDYTADNTVSGTDPIAGTTLNPEKSAVTTKFGSYIPFAAKASLDLDKNVVTLGADFYTTSSQFEATFNDAIETAPAQLSNKVVTTFMGLGMSDVIQVLPETKLIPTLAICRKSARTMPAAVTDASLDRTEYTNVFPYTSLGVEHVEKNVWKFDQIILRAGGNKILSWPGETGIGGGSKTDASFEQTSSRFVWTTGVALVVGRFELAMAVDANSWDGVDFLNSVGPKTSTITMTYDFNAAPVKK